MRVSKKRFLKSKKITYFILFISLKAKNYKVALPTVDIDLTIANELGHINETALLNKLLSDAKRDNYCLLHLFTGQWIKLGEDGIIHGFTPSLGNIFGESNVGATSIYDCGDPWKVACLLTFPHELAHSMGASHDGTDETRSRESHLMPAYNDMETPVSANNLKLSPAAVGNMTSFLVTKSGFVNSKCKFDDFCEFVVVLWLLILTFITHSLPPTAWAHCGNGIVEVGEQCDEGTSSLCCNNRCQLQPSASCSPFNSLCCTEECHFKVDNKEAKKDNSTNFTRKYSSAVGSASSACVPWNYCPDAALFCAHKRHFCVLEEPEIDCEAVAAEATAAAAPVSVKEDNKITNENIIEKKVEGVAYSTLTSTPPTTMTPQNEPDNSNKNWLTAIIIGAVCIVAIVVIVVGAIYYLVKKLKRDKRNANSVVSDRLDSDQNQSFEMTEHTQKQLKEIEEQILSRAKQIQIQIGDQLKKINEDKDNLTEEIVNRKEELENIERELKENLDKISSSSENSKTIIFYLILFYYIKLYKRTVFTKSSFGKVDETQMQMTIKKRTSRATETDSDEKLDEPLLQS